MARGKPRLIWIQGFPTVGRRFKHPENWHVVPLVPDIRGHVRSNLLGVPIWKMAGFVAQNSNVFFAISILTPFAFHPYLGKILILTNIFQVGWNHQPDKHDDLFFDVPPKKKRAHLDFFWTTEGCLYYDMEIDSRMDGNVSLGEVWKWCSCRLSHDSRPQYARHVNVTYDFFTIHPFISMCQFILSIKNWMGPYQRTPK